MHTGTGEIVANAAYSKQELMARAGWGKAAWQSARSNGLRVVQRNRRSYVLGQDFILYLTAAPSSADASELSS